MYASPLARYDQGMMLEGVRRERGSRKGAKKKGAKEGRDA